MTVGSTLGFARTDSPSRPKDPARYQFTPGLALP